MVREFANEHPMIAGALAVIVPLLIIFFVWRSGTQRNEIERALQLAWYTDDDGKTWYAGEKTLTPPFDHNGKTSVRAIIFSCDGGKTMFVAYLQRYTADARQAIEQARAQVQTQKAPPPVGMYETFEKTAIEVKKPGDSTWVNVRSPQAAAIQKVTCPGGGTVQQIFP